MKISCAFPTTMSSHEDIRIAEEIGYHWAWLYDTPQNSPDVWVSLALAAERTKRIGLGPGVLVPTLRHPMTNAAATATLVELAPGRVAVSFGTGFTGRRAMGYRAIPWSFMTAYIDAYCGLLRGDIVEWEGARMQMLQPDGSGAPRPVDVPILIGALGPKGRAIAEKFDGVFAATTVEGIETPRVEMPLACSRARVCIARATSEPVAIRTLPGGKEWLATVMSIPENERHLGVHVGHCIHLNKADEAAWAVTGGSLLPTTTLTGTAAEVRARAEQLAEQGVTEMVYQPAGPNPRRELETMYNALSK